MVEVRYVMLLCWAYIPDARNEWPPLAGQVTSSTRIDKTLNHDKNFMLNLHPKADSGGHVVVQMTHGQTHE
jgi:hypothetical protein